MVVVSNIFYVHPYLGTWFPFWQAYFSDGLVQPPTSYSIHHTKPIQKAKEALVEPHDERRASGNSREFCCWSWKKLRLFASLQRHVWPGRPSKSRKTHLQLAGEQVSWWQTSLCLLFKRPQVEHMFLGKNHLEMIMMIIMMMMMMIMMMMMMMFFFKPDYKGGVGFCWMSATNQSRFEGRLKRSQPRSDVKVKWEKKIKRQIRLYCWWFRNPKQPPGMYKTM